MRRSVTLVLTRIGLPSSILAATCLSSSLAAGSTDWRFCIGSDPTSRHIYLTPLFESSDDGRRLEALLLRALFRAGKAVQNTQCPEPADQATAMAARNVAVKFQTAQGHDITAVEAP